jgi:S-adenosylmethionine decarboxylase
MNVGKEWIIDAAGCSAARLRDRAALARVLARVVDELGLTVVGEPQWRVFPGEGGVTGLVMLSESHLSVHTYPEYGIASFNLYCCRERPAWPWEERLREMLDATSIVARVLDRGAPVIEPCVASSGR